MIPLDSPRWATLQHAYGSAADTPELLRQLERLPPDDERDAEPYFSLWSALCHQGDVYTASYAAVPHIVRIMQSDPRRAPWTLFALVAAIEAERLAGGGPPMPPDLAVDYATALNAMPALVAAVACQPWDETYCRAAMAALAAARGFGDFAEILLGLEPEVVPQVLRTIRGEDDDQD